jgi:hypothetical protein
MNFVSESERSSKIAVGAMQKNADARLAIYG